MKQSIVNGGAGNWVSIKFYIFLSEAFSVNKKMISIANFHCGCNSMSTTVKPVLSDHLFP